MLLLSKGRSFQAEGAILAKMGDSKTLENWSLQCGQEHVKERLMNTRRGVGSEQMIQTLYFMNMCLYFIQ